MIGAFIAAGLALVLALSLPRVLAGPTLYDRVLATMAVCVQGVLIAAALSVAGGQSIWIDVCFALVAATLVLSIAVLKFFRMRTLQTPLTNVGDAN